MKAPVEVRFWSKAEIRALQECWPWLGSTDGYGRGSFWLDGKRHRAPRIAWALTNGREFPENLHACHSCDNPNCVNPAHIWPGTHQENMIDAVNKGRIKPSLMHGKNWNAEKTHCNRGHSFEEHGVIGFEGRRKCRLCERIHRTKYNRRVRSENRAALSERRA